MDSEKIVREQLLDLLRGGHAHIDLAQSADQFPLAFINVQPPNSDYTPWRLLEHMRIAQWDILEFIRNPHHVSPPWPEGYWPTSGKLAHQDQWEQTIAGFRADLRALQELVDDPQRDLFVSIPHAPGYSILREILVAADHNAYHLGELSLLRRLIGAK